MNKIIDHLKKYKDDMSEDELNTQINLLVRDAMDNTQFKLIERPTKKNLFEYFKNMIYENTRNHQ